MAGQMNEAYRLIQTYFIRAWLGPDLDQTTRCPVAVEGVVFDPTLAEDVAPFTPEEVRETVGWISLTYDELDSYRSEIASCEVLPGGQHRGRDEAITRLRFGVRIPHDGDSRLAQTYMDEIVDLLRGLYLRSEDPLVTIQQPANRAPVRRRPQDDGAWWLYMLELDVEIHTWRLYVGKQEVA